MILPIIPEDQTKAVIRRVGWVKKINGKWTGGNWFMDGTGRQEIPAAIEINIDGSVRKLGGWWPEELAEIQADHFKSAQPQVVKCTCWSTCRDMFLRRTRQLRDSIGNASGRWLEGLARNTVDKLRRRSKTLS